MKKEFEVIYRHLYNMFENGFNKSYYIIDENYRNAIGYFTCQIYRRWLYSALLQNTQLTPANFFTFVDNEKMPIVNPVYLNDKFSVRMDYLSCCLKKHFIFSDLDTVMAYAEGGVRINGTVIEGNLTDELNIKDSFYGVYLLELLKELKLVEVLPSINTVVYASKGSYELPNLYELVAASCKISANKLNDIFGENVVSSDKIYSYLWEYTSVDKVLSDILSELGIKNMEEILAKSVKDMDNYEKHVAAIAAKTIPILDRWYICVFSFYLGIIRPILTRSYDFSEEFKLICDFAGDSNEIGRAERAIFRCPSVYSLTPLGEEVMGNKTKIDQSEIFDKTDILLIIEAIEKGWLKRAVEDRDKANIFKPVVIK